MWPEQPSLNKAHYMHILVNVTQPARAFPLHRHWFVERVDLASGPNAFYSHASDPAAIKEVSMLSLRAAPGSAAPA